MILEPTLAHRTPSMGGPNPRYVNETRLKRLYMQKVVAIALITLILLPLACADTDAPDESREAEGGHTILLEQYTTTWCDTCATIDPLVTGFVGDCSSRVVRVALHPNDHDPFGSALTSHRISLKQADHQLSLPTFWFNGQGEMEGGVSQSRLETGLLSAESGRGDWIGMRMWWDTWGNQPHDDAQQLAIHIEGALPENSSITVFRLENLEMSSEIANNGIDVHHDVATQMIVFDRNGTVSDSFEGAHGWTVTSGNLYSEGGIPVYILETHGQVDGFVTVIEADGVVRGVIGISNGEIPRNTENYANFSLLLLMCALVCSGVISRQGNVH